VTANEDYCHGDCKAVNAMPTCSNGIEHPTNVRTDGEEFVRQVFSQRKFLSNGTGPLDVYCIGTGFDG
jgi:hypothetical protein